MLAHYLAGNVKKWQNSGISHRWENFFIHLQTTNKILLNKIDINILDEAFTDDFGIFDKQSRIKTRFIRSWNFVWIVNQLRRQKLDPHGVRGSTEVEICDVAKTFSKFVNVVLYRVVAHDRERFNLRRAVIVSVTFGERNLERLQVNDDIEGGSKTSKE